MKPLLKKFFFLNLFLIMLLSARGQTEENSPLPEQRAILDTNLENPVLYHASFKVLKYRFTGLIVFKYLPEKKHFHVVFLSETGLSLAEFTANNTDIKVLKTLPVANRKSIKKYMAGIIRLITTSNECRQIKYRTDDGSDQIICKGKYGKHYYLYSDQNMSQISYKKSWRRRAVGKYDSEVYPTNILLYKGKNPKVEMKIIEHAIK